MNKKSFLKCREEKINQTDFSNEFMVLTDKINSSINENEARLLRQKRRKVLLKGVSLLRTHQIIK
jgi:mannose/fructose-specific phosphotransferase system component IIA